MKKPWNIILACLLLLAVVWGFLLNMDYRAVMSLHDPIIAQHIGAEGGTYQGPGWRVELEKIHVTENVEDMGWVTRSAEIYLFGILIGAAIT